MESIILMDLQSRQYHWVKKTPRPNWELSSLIPNVHPMIFKTPDYPSHFQLIQAEFPRNIKRESEQLFYRLVAGRPTTTILSYVQPIGLMYPHHLKNFTAFDHQDDKSEPTLHSNPSLQAHHLMAQQRKFWFEEAGVGNSFECCVQFTISTKTVTSISSDARAQTSLQASAP
ncbi:hypothetical protein TNCT_75961 [Trichonephila clavata]|uniref:Uncharacterized protein n=1 Tax=Trichonephila clavata TaxID=2740835 RepID=A0A8X6LDK4_TRICU|nr:hypothetical protein TNCT_75961 [Trichonephila clavata]